MGLTFGLPSSPVGTSSPSGPIHSRLGGLNRLSNALKEQLNVRASPQLSFDDRERDNMVMIGTRLGSAKQKNRKCFEVLP